MINSNGPVTNAVFARLREHQRKAPVDGARRAAFFGGGYSSLTRSKLGPF